MLKKKTWSAMKELCKSHLSLKTLMKNAKLENISENTIDKGMPLWKNYRHLLPIVKK